MQSEKILASPKNLLRKLMHKPAPELVEIGSGTIIRRARELPFSELDDELFAIDAQAGYCYSLNEQGGRIWELIDPPAPVHAICARLRAEYAVDEETCLRDVIDLLEQFRQAGLVEAANPADNY